jgi:hypothetical protein
MKLLSVIVGEICGDLSDSLVLKVQPTGTETSRCCENPVPDQYWL